MPGALAWRCYLCVKCRAQIRACLKVVFRNEAERTHDDFAAVPIRLDFLASCLVSHSLRSCGQRDAVDLSLPAGYLGMHTPCQAASIVAYRFKSAGTNARAIAWRSLQLLWASSAVVGWENAAATR